MAKPLRVVVTMLVAGLQLLATAAYAQVPGWDPRWPSPESALQGRDPSFVREFREKSAALARNPRDVEARNRRAYLAMEFARKGAYRVYWHWLAAKDLEAVVQQDPRNFYAWHNYGDLNYNAGDLWMLQDHSNAQRSVDAFTHAIALDPRAARSYMGRGWSYLAMGDEARAEADFRRALDLEPALRPSLEAERRQILQRKRDEAGARGTVAQMGRYYVERSAHSIDECDKFKGTWTSGECRISMALYPGPVQPYEAGR